MMVKIIFVKLRIAIQDIENIAGMNTHRGMKNTREENYESITTSSETEVNIKELESSLELMTKGNS